MEVKKYYCDRVGCNEERVGHFKAFSHTESDASGNGHVTWYLHFDLCRKDAELFFNRLLEFNERIEPKLVALKLQYYNIKYRIE